MSHVTVDRRVAVAMALLVCWALPMRADGQATAGYRGFRLGTSVEAVAAAARLTPAAVQTLHTRPALIQELDWWPPHVRRGTADDAEPVDHMTFSFHNDQLYRIAVTFSPEAQSRTSVADLTAQLSVEYGRPTESARDVSGDARDGVLLAAWDMDDLACGCHGRRRRCGSC